MGQGYKRSKEDTALSSEIARKAIDLIVNSIDTLHPDRRKQLPPVFDTGGRWMAIHNEFALALFYLTPQELKRAVDCQNKKINPFAGLLAFQEDQKPVAIQVKGANNIFASNRVPTCIHSPHLLVQAS